MCIAAQTDVRWRPVLAFAEFPVRISLVKLDVAVAAEENSYENFCCLEHILIGMALMVFWVVSTAHAEMASVYGGPDGYCGSRTANGERVDCSAMTAAHRRLPFGTRVRVCHSRCVTVRINDRGPWVKGRDIDLTPAAARAIDLDGTGRVSVSLE